MIVVKIFSLTFSPSYSRKRYLYSLFNMSLLTNMTVAYSLVIINSVLNIEKVEMKGTIGEYQHSS